MFHISHLLQQHNSFVPLSYKITHLIPRFFIVGIKSVKIVSIDKNDIINR